MRWFPINTSIHRGSPVAHVWLPRATHTKATHVSDISCTTYGIFLAQLCKSQRLLLFRTRSIHYQRSINSYSSTIHPHSVCWWILNHPFTIDFNHPLTIHTPFIHHHIFDIFMRVDPQILIELSSSLLQIQDEPAQPKDLPPQCLVQTEAHCNEVGAGS